MEHINEKKLTPNELKKREEVANAIEKDDPDMDMGKKMAIATSTAKRVAEADTHTVPKTKKEKDLAAAAYPHDKITHKDVLVKRGVVKEDEDELVEFVIGTKVHHPYLGPKGGEVVKPESNGFNHDSGVKNRDSHVNVKASNGKVYKFAAHSLKKSTSDKEAETMKPLTMNSLRKESVIRSAIESAKQLSMVESAPCQLMSFKNFSEVYESVIEEGYNDTYKRAIDWSDMGGTKVSKKYDDNDDDIYGTTSKVHKAKAPAAQPKEKKNVGRPAGDYGSYKIDTAKRNSDVYKAELSAKVRAAKADGFAARKEFKDAMNAALKKREQELFGESKRSDSDIVDTLRKSWSSIERIDPSNPTYKQLTKLLDSLDKDVLQKLVDAKIKFVSGMAMNRINKMDSSNK
jgi:hypothetical protein